MIDLPSELEAGKGTAIFLQGSCSHPRRSIRGLRIVIGDQTTPVLAHSMPRPGTIEPGDWWWAIVPLEPGESARTATVEIEALLWPAGRARRDIASINLIAATDRPALNHREAAKRADGSVTGVQILEPKVTICMATHAPDLHLFRDQIESIRIQTYRNWSCLICDDASPPRHREAMRKIVASDERFELIENPKRLGFYRNFERALRLAPAESPYIALADQDDRWHPDKLESLLAEIGPGAMLAYADMRTVAPSGEVASETYWGLRRNNHSNLTSLLMLNSVTGASALMRRELLDYALPFPPAQGECYHDHWLALVARSLGPITYVDRPLHDHVRHPGSETEKISAVRLSREPGESRAAWTRRRARSLRRRGYRPDWREHYFGALVWRLIAARVLLARCAGYLTAADTRSLRRVRLWERSLRGLLWLSLRSRRRWLGATETHGMEKILLRAVVWRRLARPRARVLALRSGRRPNRMRSGDPRSVNTQQSPAMQATDRASGVWLTPLLVDYFTRDGSTLLMRLLATSPEVAMERSYPFEHKYFAYLWRWSRLLDRPAGMSDNWDASSLTTLSGELEGEMVGPPPWMSREMMDSLRSDVPMGRQAFNMMWGEMSRRAVGEARRHFGDEAAPRYYAEKHNQTWKTNLTELPPVRLVIVLRDPRDTYVSIREFTRVEPQMTPLRLEHFIALQRERLEWIARMLDGELVHGEPATVVLYEDLVREPEMVAEALRTDLGISVSDKEARDDKELARRHRTSPDAISSIGRWRTELEPEPAERISADLEPQLARLGFSD